MKKKTIDETLKNASNQLHNKINTLDLSSLNISDYNKNYLSKYIHSFPFYISIYSQLFKKALLALQKPIQETTFVDYGGGCGMLSFLAKELGFKSVIYSDIYSVSVSDSKEIASHLNIKIDTYISGDIEEFVNYLKKNNIKPDLICSIDVIEHIYDLKYWFEKLAELNNDFQLFFMTSANTNNFFIRNRLKKVQIKAEFQGFSDSYGWKQSDVKKAYLEVRREFIKTEFPRLKSSDIELLAKRTRGLRKDDIKIFTEEYLKTGLSKCHLSHPTNTCDPNNGNWTEHLIDLKLLKNILSENSYKVRFTNSYYAYSQKKILNTPKFLLNILIKFLGSESLLLSPTYTLEVIKPYNKDLT
jgi:2-polyprenyl-3-methyl-5-hydroxy-6-metoxy-1,4-benzoquinol methylase